MWAAFPDARVERTGPLMTEGRHVADPVKLVATHRGELEGLPASGNFVVVHAVLICELADDEDVLWRIRAFYDAYGRPSSWASCRSAARWGRRRS